MALHTILFEAEGVIFTRPQTHLYLRNYLQRYGIEPRHPVVVQRALKAAYFDVIHGRITREAFYDAMLRFHGLEDEDAFPEGREALLMDAAQLEPVEDALQMLPDLHDHGYRLVMVANTEHRARNLLDWTAAIGFPPELWLGIFTSSELRLASPDPEFFSIVLDDLRCDWVEVAYVVSQEKQLLALMDRGLKTIGFQLQPSETFHVHHTINTFNDLSGLLYKLNDYGDTLLHGDY